MKSVRLVAVVIALPLLAACEETRLTRGQESALAGGAIGATGGAILGAIAGAPALGAALGGAAGVAATTLADEVNLW